MTYTLSAMLSASLRQSGHITWLSALSMKATLHLQSVIEESCCGSSKPTPAGLLPILVQVCLHSTPLCHSVDLHWVQTRKGFRISLSLNGMIGQTLITGEAPLPVSNQQDVQLKFLLSGLLPAGLPLPPFAICMYPSLTTKNINQPTPAGCWNPVASVQQFIDKTNNKQTVMNGPDNTGLDLDRITI
ncbi:WD repeat-containing protein 11-like isoform X1 [Thunnus maccoyii]|uniref:WD repeat-containing protein 11-like isoform X1 n=1 Tax=Thunnus maccoyii TaxID=8240 RepID=UPI001C4CD0FE|nr:WD repeat-containing protein 11-like isoform X1 [Thunnus maccoyii]